MSKDNITNYGKSIRRKLLNVAKKEDVFYQTVLTRYFQERLLYRMSQTRYRDNFYLKGGALLYAFERFAARPTLDIDFLGHNISNEGNIVIAAFREICSVPNILAYSIETVIAEKMHAVIDLADQSSRMKDYYDLFNLLSKEKYDSETLQEAIIRTFENRHTSYDANTMFFRKDFAGNSQMQTKWKAFLRKITKEADVSFFEVVTYIQTTLKPYWEKMSNV